MIAVLSALILAGVLLLSTNFSFIGKKSIHDDAKKYATRHCLAFYPDSKAGFSKAKELCKGVKDDRIYDYTLVPYGDYYLVNYGGDFRYFTDKRFEPLVVKEISDNGEKMIVDYIRYTFKKQMPDKYYNADFIRRDTKQINYILLRMLTHRNDMRRPRNEFAFPLQLTVMESVSSRVSLRDHVVNR